MGEKGVKIASCRGCAHFDKRGENKDGRAYGMCRAWGFSINEHDGRGCTSRQTEEQREAAKRE